MTYQVVGAFWYLFSVESRLRCWRRQLKTTMIFHESYLSCGRNNPIVLSLLKYSCPYTDPESIENLATFNFGMFVEALKSRVVESTTDFTHKFFYCFWWGLRSVRLVNKSSLLLPQYMQHSHFILELLSFVPNVFVDLIFITSYQGKHNII